MLFYLVSIALGSLQAPSFKSSGLFVYVGEVFAFWKSEVKLARGKLGFWRAIRQGNTPKLTVLIFVDVFLDFEGGGGELAAPLGRADAQGAVAEDDVLLLEVGGDYSDVVGRCDLIGRALDVGVGGFTLLGVDDGDVTVFLHRALAVPHTVGVKDDDDASMERKMWRMMSLSLP